MEKITQMCYVNGKFVPENKAFISIFDIGLLRGYGVFDFLVTYKGRPFLIDEHINRLFHSAKQIDLNIGKTKSEVKKIILRTLKKNKNGMEYTIRIVVTGGVGKNSLEPSSKSSLILMVHPKHNYPAKIYSEGIRIITFNYVRPMASTKSLEYSTAVRALKKAHSKKAIEALYFNNNSQLISEATTSNLFVIKNNQIFTPVDKILNGITKKLLIRLYSKSNPIIEKNISLNEVLSADEVFISASNKEVMPVVKIDNRTVGNGKVGPITMKVMKTFREFVDSGNW